jgi:hypothetical protein
MREILFFVASLAGAMILTALAVLLQQESPIWRWTLWIGIAVFTACACVLLIDYLRPGGKAIFLFGIGAGIALLIISAIAFVFNQTKIEIASDHKIISNPYAKFTPAELREKTFLFATQLRNFEAEYDRKDDEARNRLHRETRLPVITEDGIAQENKLFREIREETQKISRQKQNEYSSRFQSEAKLIFEALSVKLRLTDNENNRSPFIMSARAMIESSRLAGAAPVTTIANYLEDLARRL